MIEWCRSEWNDEATEFMKSQGRWLNCKGTHYFCGKVDGEMFWLFSTPRTIDGWAEINTFANWTPLVRSRLTKKQKRATRDVGMLVGLTWIFEERNNIGIYGKFEETNKTCIMLQGVVDNPTPLEKTTSTSQTGKQWLKWQYSREQFRNSDIYQRAKEAVYDL